MSISKLKNALGGDVSRQNQFRVIVNPPPILGISLAEVDRLSIVAKSVSDPESSIGSITLYSGAKPINFRGDREYSPITVDYRYDANLLVHDALYQWQEFLVSHDGFTASRSITDYAGTIIIEKLRQRQAAPGQPNDLEPEVIKRCFVYDAFPTNVPGFGGLDADSANEPTIVSVTFTYSNFKWERV